MSFNDPSHPRGYLTICLVVNSHSVTSFKIRERFWENGGVRIFKCTYLLCDIYLRCIAEGGNILFRCAKCANLLENFIFFHIKKYYFPAKFQLQTPFFTLNATVLLYLPLCYEDALFSTSALSILNQLTAFSQQFLAIHS